MARRIVLAVLGLLSALLCAVAIPLGLITAQHYRQDYRAQAVGSARSLASVAEEKLGDGETGHGLATAVVQVRSDGDEVAVFGRVGTRIAGSGPGASASVVRAVLSGRSASTSWAGDHLLVVVPVPSDEEHGILGVVSLSRPTGPLSRRIAVLWAWLAATALAGLVAGSAVAIMLARWVGRPLIALDGVARQLGNGALGTRSGQARGPREVRSLAASFDTMAGRLEALVNGHQAMMADVSHQLRTPLAALRLRLDFLAEDADQQMAAEVAGAQEEISRLSRLVDGLLAVARAENVVVRPGLVAADQVIRDRADAWRLAAAERGVEVTCVCPGPVRVSLGDGHLEQILDNLLANALDAVPPGGHVRVRGTGTATGPMAAIEVADDGPGMSEAQRQAAFHRFASSTPGGSGLGLAIVYRLVTSNGGRVELSGTPGGGLTVSLRLPSAPADRVARRPGARSS
ncbi:MAG: HAMP domain-containing sensor histidine kinase [Actinomycetota bacterium]